MTIENVNELANALANNSSRLVIDKVSVANTAAGQLFSLWIATGQPSAAATPTTAAVPTMATAGAFQFTPQTAPLTSYLGWMSMVGAISNGIEIHDRVAQYGGLSLAVTTAQTITGLDLLTLAPPAARLGSSNYSDVQWFLECYAAGGATASNATINVTYDDGTTGNLTILAVGGTLRAGRMLPLTPQIPSAQQGKYIRGINSVTLSGSTGTPGNFGFTCTRQRTGFGLLIPNVQRELTWDQLGLPEIPNDSCLSIVVNCTTTTTGVIRGQGKIAHG